MSSKEAKAIIKEVREDLKRENYFEAIRKCKNLLQTEPNSYLGHLYLGAAYQNVDKTEAAKYLRKAVTYSPAEPTVALQGLANCAPNEELPAIYEQLLELVPEKCLDYYEKLLMVSKGSGITALACFQVLKRAVRKTNTDEQLQSVYKNLAKLWISGDYEVPDKEETLYKLVLEQAIADTALEEHFTACKRYLKLLYKQTDFANCIKYACYTVELYPTDSYAYAWICKIFSEDFSAPHTHGDWQDALKEPVEHYATAYLNINSNAWLALLVQAISVYKEQKYIAARDLLIRVQKLQTDYRVCQELLARTQMHLGAFGLALLLWKQLGNFQNEYIICLSHSDEATELREAVDLVLKSERTDDQIKALARCYFKLNETEKLEELQVEVDVLTRIEFMLKPAEAIEMLKISGSLTAFPTLLLMGKSQLGVCNYAEALTTLLQATRLQPYYYECFLVLAKIYYATKDIVRTRKCYEKCVNINPLCEEAVNNLSAIYQQCGEEELNEALLLNTLQFMKTSSSKRVQFKLGLHYLNTNKWDNAIHAFRTAIKFDVTGTTYWEALGDAYAARGSYNSAIRVFQKLLEMEPTNIYAKLQIAILKTTVRMYSEAIEDIDNLLIENPDYLPCLKAAAEAHIGLANNLKLEHRYGRCKAHLQLATNFLQRAFMSTDNRKMVWLWRMTANVFTQTARMPTSMANLDVMGELVSRKTDTEFLTRKDLLNLATRFYTCALKLKQDTYLWYELALCWYYSAEYLHDEADMRLDLAMNAAKMAIKEQSNRWQNWNLLGVINMHRNINNLRLAQHCFIQALQLERKSYTAWTNLGVMYLHLQEIKLANQAFQRAQQSSPIYPNAWIGQALVAEAITEEEEALDLFRHCQQFEFHPESALGYAHWVCNVLADPAACAQSHYKHAVENMYADILALDAINWYTRTEQENAIAAAYSFQGFLCMRHKTYGPALKAYLLAAEKATVGVERNKILTNLGYLYLKLKQPNEAINTFNKVTQATFRPIIGLAMAYHHAGQHQESYSVYNSVLKTVAGNEDDKASQILIAMAAMVYAFQGETDTKTILYQCILLKDSPIQALYSACALGILHGDHELTETIVPALRKFENCMEYVPHIAFLTAQYYLANNEPRKAVRYIVSRVHVFPQCAELRKVLANFLLDNYPNDPHYVSATSQVALSAIALVHSNKAKKSDRVDDAKSLLIASRAVQAVNKQRSLKLLQRAVHLCPEDKSAWDALREARSV